MNAPVRLDDVVMAEMLWASFKALFTVTAILGVMLVLDISHSWKLLLAWPVLWMVGVTFSCIALIFNALAKGYDFFTYYFTLFLTPMMFLSGIYFPRTQLPGWLQTITDYLPLTAAIELVRPLFLANPCRQQFVFADRRDGCRFLGGLGLNAKAFQSLTSSFARIF
jgi:lipooligosaccharide transport system permease protein